MLKGPTLRDVVGGVESRVARSSSTISTINNRSESRPSTVNDSRVTIGSVQVNVPSGDPYEIAQRLAQNILKSWGR